MERSALSSASASGAKRLPSLGLGLRFSGVTTVHGVVGSCEMVGVTIGAASGDSEKVGGRMASAVESVGWTAKGVSTPVAVWAGDPRSFRNCLYIANPSMVGFFSML